MTSSTKVSWTEPLNSARRSQASGCGLLRRTAWGMSLLLLVLSGCDSGTPATDPSTTTAPPVTEEPEPPTPPVIQSRSVLGDRSRQNSQSSDEPQETDSNDEPSEEPESNDEPSVATPPARTLGELMQQSNGPFVGRRMEIDEERVQAAGVVRVEGSHLVLYSDMRDEEILKELVTVFDAAVPVWCQRFDIDADIVSEWKVNGFLIKDKERMEQAGLFPNDLPPFPNGYFRGFEFWFYDQPSDFYRRYLMLHEGTHAFMNHQLGSAGPPWYMEGLAERLACHRWNGEQLEMDITINSSEEAPYWGRVRIIQDAFAEQSMYMPLVLFQMDNQEFLKNESYGWAWAMCEFFGRHPRFSSAFEQLSLNVQDRSPTFAQPLIDAVGADWDLLQEDWQLFVANMEYGYDIERNSVVRNKVETLTGETTFDFAVDRGWQSTGIRLPPGAYEFEASGTYLMKTGNEEWPSEPDGITIDYFRGEPVGKVQIAIRGDIDLSTTITSLVQPISMGRSTRLRFDQEGELFVRVNDSPGSLADNQGSGQLTVRPIQ